jgi:hypothetical protein
MSPLPFYSQSVRENLLEIISSHHSKQGSANHDANDSRHVAASTILGRRYVDSSSEEDDDNDNDNLSNIEEDDDDGDDSSASASSGEESSDENEAEETAATLSVDDHQNNNSNSKKSNRGAKKPRGGGGKRSNNKDQLLQKMQGKAPSISLPLPQSDNKQKRQEALQIPTILFPPNYTRENPNWDTNSAAQTLLKSWDNINSSNATFIIVLIQSGRFVAAVYSLNKSTKHNRNDNNTPQLIAHKTSTRYTIRKGQGGSQSNYDSSKHKAKSVGAQLRREGEKQLREDVISTWKSWNGGQKDCNYINDAIGIYVSCPKSMRREYLFGGGDDNVALVQKGDERLRSIPLDVGRPTLDAATVALECLLSCAVVDMDDLITPNVDHGDASDNRGDGKVHTPEKKSEESNYDAVEATPETKDEGPPFTPLHEAVMEGDLQKLMKLLSLLEEAEENDDSNDGAAAVAIAEDDTATSCYDVNAQAGPDHLTPLHLASASIHQNAPSLLNALLINGHANPCTIDSRGRPPYFVAASDKVREAFRLARGALGEEYCKWDDDAKVGPALTEADVQAKKAKALEKKRKQRARQKEKKAMEKAQAEKEAAKQRQEEEKKKQMEEAKRVRDGLKPKSSTASNVCDFCQQVAKVKRRSQMFQRLDYVYCSTDCVKKHQRELMAAAAAARMGG